MDSSFISNSVVGAGVGAAILSGGQIIQFPGFGVAYTSNAVIENSTFVHNTSESNGGAIAALSAVPLTTPGAPTITVTNSTFKNNDSVNGGAIHLNTILSSITGNTFWKSNDATLLGDDIYAIGSIVNGFNTTTQASLVLQSLTSTNVLMHFDSDDIYLA